MKVLKLVVRIIIGLWIFGSLLFFYYVQKGFHWAEQRLLEKFEVNAILSDSKDFEIRISSITDIISRYKNIKFGQIKLLKKEDVWNVVAANPELRHFTSILSKNPFPDVIKLKIEKFDNEEYNLSIEEIKKLNFVKEVIFDTNVVSYLKKLSIINRYLFILEITIFIVCVLVVVIFIVNLYLTKSFLLLESGIVLGLSFVIIMLTIKFLKVFVESEMLYLTMMRCIFIGLVSLSSINLLIDKEKNKDK